MGTRRETETKTMQDAKFLIHGCLSLGEEYTAAKMEEYRLIEYLCRPCFRFFRCEHDAN